jgi:hypothetical protein
LLYNEAFHAFYDQFIEEHPSARWLRQLIAEQLQYPASRRRYMTEEAISETVSFMIGLLEDGRTLPAYADLIRGQADIISPMHNDRRGTFAGIPSANAPISEELYYATYWLLFHGTADPIAGRPETSRFDSLKGFFDASNGHAGGAKGPRLKK